MILIEYGGGLQQVSRQLLKVVDQSSGREYRKRGCRLTKVGGDLPGRCERPNAILSVSSGRRQVVVPLGGHDILNEEPYSPGCGQRSEIDARSDRHR